MTADDMLLVVLAVIFAFVTGYVIGKISMLGAIVQAVIEEVEKDSEQKKADNILTVEKHNNVYYAYIDGNFAAQGANFDELFTAVKSNKNYSVVNINRATASDPHLTREEALMMAEAIARVYGKKE